MAHGANVRSGTSKRLLGLDSEVACVCAMTRIFMAGYYSVVFRGPYWYLLFRMMSDLRMRAAREVKYAS